jgi:myosin heavy subunit
LKNLTVDVKLRTINNNIIIDNDNIKTIKIENENIYRIDHKDSLNVADITSLNKITIVDLLNNIKNRFEQKIITSTIGNELILVNPFEFYQDYLSAEKMNYYIEVIINVYLLFY